MAKRVLVAGIFHETHTFLEETTGLDQFDERIGQEVCSARGDGSPLSGVLEVAEAENWELIPVIDLRATPSGTVCDEVVDRFSSVFRSVAEAEIPQGIDGVFLVLHGAMTTQSFPDVEGELLRRIRKIDGANDVPICAVFDLHGNISRDSVDQLQGLIGYRSNPHTDACAAAVDAARLLQRIMTTAETAQTVWVQPPIMWPPTGTATADEPMCTLEKMAREIEAADPAIAAVSVFAGFSFADTPDTGVSFTATTFGNPESARKKLDEMNAWTIEHQEQGNRVDESLSDAMPSIQDDINGGRTPVVIVEPADNIGGGAPGDATTILRTLIEHRIDNSAVVINDPRAVAEIDQGSLSPGSTTRLTIGGGSQLTDGPLELDVEILARSDGKFELEDHHSHLASMMGIHIDMGACAVVRHQGVTILLTSRKTPPFDLAQLRSQGIVPEKLNVIGVKAAVAHRRAYDTISKSSYTVDTPGPCSSNLSGFPFKKVRRPIYPLDE